MIVSLMLCLMHIGTRKHIILIKMEHLMILHSHSYEQNYEKQSKLLTRPANIHEGNSNPIHDDERLTKNWKQCTSQRSWPLHIENPRTIPPPITHHSKYIHSIVCLKYIKYTDFIFSLVRPVRLPVLLYLFIICYF